jgi:hypothetical protein
MDNTELAVAIFAVNIVVGLIVLAWCNKKIKELTDRDNWK